MVIWSAYRHGLYHLVFGAAKIRKDVSFEPVCIGEYSELAGVGAGAARPGGNRLGRLTRRSRENRRFKGMGSIAVVLVEMVAGWDTCT
jgi:hypothetical protein